LITKTAVLVGYSLDDPDFRQIWQVVAQRLGKTRRQAYAIAVGAQPADVSRFARRGVTLINLPKKKREQYGEVLAAAFDELAAHWRDNVLGVSTVTEEAPLRELKLPKDSSSRLVFFAVPLHRLPVYRERVFPAVTDIGLVPVTADDVVSPGDSISAKIDALMDRAAAIVVEVGSTWTSAELRLAVSRAREPNLVDGRTPRIIVVGNINAPQTAANLNRQFITRIDLNTENDEGILQLVEELRIVVPPEALANREPARLLEKGEYRAAVISATGLLEATLRKRLEKPAWNHVSRPMSMRQLVDAADFQNLNHEVDSTRIAEWIRVRNEAVHTNLAVSKETAQSIVEGVFEIIDQLI